MEGDKTWSIIETASSIAMVTANNFTSSIFQTNKQISGVCQIGWINSQKIKKEQIYYLKNEKVWQTEVKAISIN